MRRATVFCVSLIAMVAALAPTSASAATLQSTRWCGVENNDGSPQFGYDVKPGKWCGTWPYATNFVVASWDVLGSGGHGQVCVGIASIFSSPPVPLNDQGQPGQWECTTLRAASGGNWNLVSRHHVQNAFAAVYGQPTILNFSTATIRMTNAYTRVDYWR